MATSDKKDDEEDKKLTNKRGRDIQPLHEEELKKKLAKDKEMAQANAEVLAELAKKTAELAEQVKGDEGPGNRTLKLENNDEKEPVDIYDELEKAAIKPDKKSNDPNPAAELIRQKLNKLYNNEPGAAEEAAESIISSNHRSKHQEFMYKLTTSGKSLADIQTEWHNYYVDLPNDEKHQVWQEFYQNQSAVSKFAQTIPHANKVSKDKPLESKKYADPYNRTGKSGTRTVGDVKDQILDKINAGGRLNAGHHFKSLLFGLGLAGFVGLIITFVFFNEVFIAPFISPSRTVSATPIIGNSVTDIGPEPKIIIPKINLEVPVVYDLGTTDESTIQNGLEEGVVHYAASPEPGEKGNVVIVGHSSNNILNSGKYKFAFVLLKRLENEDTFFIHKDGVRYTYKVFEKKIVSPTDVSVLGPSSRDNTITLITCDPPGTSINRLIVVAEQISPDPNGNVESDIDPADFQTTEELPSNAPSLWSRLTPW